MGLDKHDVSVCVGRPHWNGVGDGWFEYLGSPVCLSVVIDNVHDSYLSNVLRDVYDV